MKLADKRFKAKDKIVQKMTRDGLVDENLRTGEKKAVEQEETASAEQPDAVTFSTEDEISEETLSEESCIEADSDAAEDFEEEIPKRRSTVKQSSDFYRRQQAEAEQSVDADTDSDSIGLNEAEQPAKKSRLSFDDEQGGIVRGAGMGIKKAAKKGVSVASGYAHNKVHQAEKENSGVEAAHKSEEAAEWAHHHFKGKPKGKKTKEKSARAEKKQDEKNQKERLQFSEDEGGAGEQAEATTKPKAKTAAQKTAKNSVKDSAEKAAVKTHDAKFYQKKRYKDAYAAAKRGKQTGEEVGKQAATATNTISTRIKAFVQENVTRNKSVWLTVSILALLFLLIFGSFSSCSAFIQGSGSTFVGTTYPSKDADMKETEKAYLKLEEKLNEQINQIESTHPGYDEYRYALDEIGHDPYQLISHLTAVYEQFTFGQVEKVIEALFKQQYILKVWETIEIRTRTETRYSYDPFTGESSSYEVEVEYEYKILNIQLKNEGFDKIARKNMSRDETGRYDAYNLTYGNRPELFGAGSPTYSGRTVGYIGTGGSGSGTSSGSSGGYQYDIPAEALSDEKFARMIAEAEKYLGRAYVWGGSSPSTGFDCSGFVSWVINNSGNGWNVGRQTAEGLRQSTTYVSADHAQPGDLIFFEKTYNTTGASHVGIYVGDGMMIHCGDPISYTSIYSNYWQSHFLGFGRIS